MKRTEHRAVVRKIEIGDVWKYYLNGTYRPEKGKVKIIDKVGNLVYGKIRHFPRWFIDDYTHLTKLISFQKDGVEYSRPELVTAELVRRRLIGKGEI